ncbi:HupE/UreJ family protein [Cryobacterium sp. GrIS_2_6]|uniref:HupE/UreJ family protein n=1 Tax=Cryobacterium sp. GrIS_2_6 TaxID=3162785 RepID=UPI002E0910B6|nr:hypothetical protein [Cryobacterium psychrotolerans]
MTPVPPSPAVAPRSGLRRGTRRMRGLAGRALLSLVGALAIAVLSAQPASAHILPTSTVILDVHASVIDAHLRNPLDDVEAASGLDLGTGTAAEVAAQAEELRTYILAHFHPTSPSGEAWSVTVDGFATGSTEELGTGVFGYITVTAHMVPPPGADERAFNLGYDVVAHQVVTHVVLVSLGSDWSAGTGSRPREIGTIKLDTVSGDVTPLTVALGEESAWSGFASMVVLGISHIRATLADLDLSGGQLALSLLGFNIGIELMQLVVVALVLPPLIVLARTSGYRPLRLTAATLAGIAATGWLLARLSIPNAVSDAADGLTGASFLVVCALWFTALVLAVVEFWRMRKPAESA